MKAVVLTDFDTPPVVTGDLPAPAPAEGEVLVRVRGSSANPVDNAIAAGMLRGIAEYEFPVVLGRDYAGVVEDVGCGVTRFAPGDEVYGFITYGSHAIHHGTWAEYTPEAFGAYEAASQAAAPPRRWGPWAKAPDASDHGRP